ncbi:MAG: tetraacyldisaccharide 4'-kinase, partial [Nanoarchaeota archaeon]
NVVLIDAGKKLGTGHLLPRGVLREPLPGLLRADCFMIKGGGVPFEITGAGKPSFGFFYRPSALRCSDGSERPLEFLRRKKVAIVSGIASPESFEGTVKELGPEIKKVFIYPDHHSYSREDVLEITRGTVGLDVVVTTEKDSVKLFGLWPNNILLLAISIEVEIENQEGFFELISKG